MVQDFAKELPEDDMLDLGEIPGLVPPAKASFTYIQDEVCEHLAGETPAVREEVLQRLEVLSLRFLRHASCRGRLRIGLSIWM